jgi:hypothetical protein
MDIIQLPYRHFLGSDQEPMNGLQNAPYTSRFALSLALTHTVGMKPAQREQSALVIE